jgi:phage terminase large subunit-like protein
MKKVEIRLDYAPRAWQRECHVRRKRFTVLALHRRAGKTTLAVMELIKKSTGCQQPLGLYVYVAPFLKQAKAIAWAMLKHKLEPMRVVGAVDINESELSVKFKHNGAMIRLFGGDNPDAMRGVRLDGVVIDEVAQIKPEVWNDILQPALSDRQGWALFIGTPSGINLFSELYYKADNLPEWFSAKYTVYDTDALAADEVERLRRDMAETSFAREYLCDFSAAGDDQLISLADVEVAARRIYTEKDVEGAPLVIGVDPARFGDDRSVVFRRRGLQAFTPWIYRGIDNMELAARVAAHINDHDPDAVFIDSGAGAGVIDRLRQLDYDVVEVPFGGKAIAEGQFVNRRSEMWWAMKEGLERGGAIPPDPALRQELATPVYWYDASGKRVLESKDEIKKRLQGGGSPDLADALALTFAHPVASRLDLPSYAKRKGKEDYDPYSQAR